MRKPALIATLLALPSLVGAALPEPGGLAPGLRATPAEEAVLAFSASGVHVYQCKATAENPAAFAWFFVAPDATLFEGTRTVGSLKTVNLWESASDRSSVSGVVRATQPAGANNLPWASYRAQPLSATGMFAGITTIQRVNTLGGAAPAAGCTAASVGTEARVPFTADFYFYRRRGAG